MGSLNLPVSGPVYLDTNGFIYSVERIEPYRSLFVTNDIGLRRVPALTTAILDDFI